jgi:glycosyltransferase involved in cell wall biosynthesis/GT2 family glycosyltransferase/predicted SAM-dependent methyltransferase
MKFSVVINTCDRADGLRRTLSALRYQTHPSFEVVVVNGPSEDHTDAVLAEFAADVRVVQCPERHLSKSRNLGIEAAAGEVIAFIDDDAIPEPRWLEQLDAAYDSPEVAGAGGLVYDHTGAKLQYRYSICDRLGEPRFDVEPPFDRYLYPGADPLVYLQGTNASFRRARLEEIGGFDEEIEYYLDEVDVCLSLIDRGYSLRSLPAAAVHHHYLPSDVRSTDRVVLDPYSTVKNRLYFALRHGTASRSVPEILDEQLEYWNGVRSHARLHRNDGRMTAEQLERFESRLEEGVQVGLARGLEGTRKSREIGSPTEPFKPFPTLQPPNGRMNVCFVSTEFPPGEFGGIGRYTVDLAAGLAELGHEVHVVTTETEQDRVDFEDGVWVHRLVTRNLDLPELGAAPAAFNLYRAATVAHELDRIHRHSPIDVVSAPLWAAEGCLCMLDGRFPTILTLMTSMHTIAGLHRSWDDDPQVAALIELERETVKRSDYLHALSEAVLADARKAYEPGEQVAAIVPLGTRDASDEHPSGRNGDGRVRILFVGRLEHRKGVDVLLDAAQELLPELPDVELVLVGKDTENTELGETYRKAFKRRFGDADWAQRVTFAGAVPDEVLFQHYADCDVFCAPSRYESFGLVLTEAMAFGKAVVGSRAGGMQEVVEDGVTGLLAEPGDAASLAEQLRSLVVEPDLRARLGTAARTAFEQKFALPVTVERTCEAYRGVASHAAAARAGRPSDRDERAMGAELADLLVSATGISEADAARAAARLLEPVPESLPELAKHLDEDEQFVLDLFEELLDRPADHDEIAPCVVQLRRGAARADVRNALAATEEALQVATRRGAKPAAPAPLPEIAPGAPPRRTLRQWARSAPGLGKALRYAKRIVTAPPNTQRTLDQSVRLEHLLRDYGDRLRSESYHDEIARYRDLERQEAVLERLLDPVSSEIGGLTAALGGLHNQVQVLHRKQEMLALNLRERVAGDAAPAQRVEPRIVDPDRYRELTATGALRLNVGCGEKPMAGYLNVDMRQGEGVEVVAEATNLPFEPGSLAEIASFHLIEHFREQQLRQTVLPYWRSLLRPDGFLRTVCPNWEAMIERLQAGEMPYDVFKTLTFGLQDYDGDDHFAMYTPASLEDALRQAGFTAVELIVAARQNGMCPEMELIAKP